MTCLLFDNATCMLAFYSHFFAISNKLFVKKICLSVHAAFLLGFVIIISNI